MTSATQRSSLARIPYGLLINLGLVLIYLTVTGVAAYVVFVRVREEIAKSEILPDFTMRRSPSESDSSNVERIEGEPLPVWTGTTRVTVLILGIDQREGEEDVWRTDTMILATLDPVTMRAGMLSIPRDLWVPIPGYTENRINTAHALGDAYRHPGGGPALAVETVEYNLGVEIDYYVRLNFSAFVDLVDLIGGIEIEVPQTIDDPCYPTPDYGCEHFYLEAGTYHFYGEEALKYARVRRTAGGDFDRARRQQQVIRAILERVTRVDILPQLAARAPEIVALVANSAKVDPNLQLDEIIALANLATKVDLDEITFRVIDESCTLPKMTHDNMAILIPLRDRIRDVRDEVFGLQMNGADAEEGQQEQATISVLNGTTTVGLALSASGLLEDNGISVAVYDNADRQDYEASVVIMNRNRPAIAQRILSLLGLPDSALVKGENPTAEHDIVVVLGADYVGQE